MVTWVLVYTFIIPANTYFNQPVVLDHFSSKEQCEITLDYINTTYNQAGISGSGHCWGEQK